MHLLCFKTIRAGLYVGLFLNLCLYLNNGWFEETPLRIQGFEYLNLLIFVGFSSVFFFVGFKKRNTKKKDNLKKSSWNGVSLSIGEIPLAQYDIKNKKKTKIKAKVKYHSLCCDLLSIIAYYPKAWAGHGRPSLFEHTKNVLNRAIIYPDADELLPLVAIAHDIGKLWSYEKISKKNCRVIKKHASVSGQILSIHPLWQKMLEPDRSLVALVVRHHHSKKVPIINGLPTDRLIKIRKQLKNIDTKSTQREKEDSRDKVDWDTIIFQALLGCLSNLKLQERGTPKGQRTHGYKKDERLYLFCRAVCDDVLKSLPIEESSLIQNEKKFVKKKMLELLKRESLLVERVEDILPVNGLFKIISGRQKYDDILILNITKHTMFYNVRDREDTTFKLKVLSSV